jgi:hypothetical protein
MLRRRIDYHLVRRVPSIEDYNRGREAAGSNRKNLQAVEAGLPNILFGVCVEGSGNVLGMGRIIGHNELFFEVVDIAVIPERQKNGLGK